MKVLIVDLEFDYGIKARGLNDIGQLGFKKSFEDLGHQVVSFYYDSYLNSTSELQGKLLDFASQVQPDLIFFCLYTNQFTFETLDKLKSKYTTINWFGDDTWRFDSFSKKYAKHFTYCITTDKFSIHKYKQCGQDKVIFSQWAALKIDGLKEKKLTSYKYDVSFVGTANPYRKWFVGQIKKAGVNVEAFGNGWPNGALPLAEMQSLFSQSKINLNLSNSRCLDIRYIFSGPISFLHTLKTAKTASQIKARNFEIPYYGGFQLTDFTPGLEDYLELGKEVACYSGIDEAILLIKYYLNNEMERESIKLKSIEKVLDHHTYQSRIKEICRAIAMDKHE